MKTFRSRIGLALGLIIPVLGGCGDDSDAAGGNEADGGSGATEPAEAAEARPHFPPATQ